MKKRKATLIIVIIVLGFIIITPTLAKFFSSASGSASVKVAPWKITLNGSDIVKAKTFNINDISWEPNESVETGLLAPGQQGEIKLIFDASGTKVSYDVNLDLNFGSEIPIKVTEVTGSKINNLVFKNSSGTTKVSGFIPLENISNPAEINIKFKWGYDDADTVDEIDTSIGKNVAASLISISVTASQHI